MIILSNCLTEKTDEGCLKVAKSLIKGIKEKEPATMVITYGPDTLPGDLHLQVNKLMLRPKLLALLWKKKEPVLYIPAVSKARSMAVRVFVLSLFARRGMKVVQVMHHRAGKLARLLLKISKAELVMLSKEAWQDYRQFLGAGVTHLKAGVDTQKFCPVPEEKKMALRKAYGLPTDKPIVLHVGHLKAGRNVGQLQKIEDRFHGLLVASSYAPDQKDAQLRQQLSARENITVLDTYLPNIQELYQLSDVYLFPVVAAHNCIDMPLSALEAAACNLPVVTTAYGQMRELLELDGFYRLQSMEPGELNRQLTKALEEKKQPRPQILDYDWTFAVDILLQSAK